MHVHLIGVAGTAMTSLARLLIELGHRVSGSDEKVYPPMSTELARLGISVCTPYAAANLDPAPDLVVIGNAIARGNPELEACLDGKLRYTSQAEAIEDLVIPGRNSIVVTGTHGKTTTTAMIAWMLHCAGREPGWFIGGIPLDLPTPSHLGKGADIVLEGDEYDTAYFDKRPKFHHYRPRILIINNVEFDHADIYDDLAAIELEFRRLVNTIPRTGVVLCGSESPSAAMVVAGATAPVWHFGTGAGDLIRATDLKSEAGGMRFSVWAGNELLGSPWLAAPGRFNVLNALAAIGVSRHLEIPFDAVETALRGFHGVKRRLELRGEQGGVTVYDDFAHHPTAIRATIDALRGRGVDGRIFAVLEPRSWSMRRNVHQHTLGNALAAAEVVVMAPVFESGKIPTELCLNVEQVLADARALGRSAHLVAGAGELAELVANSARPGDAILIMSNGGFDSAHEKVLTALRVRA